MWLKKPLHPSWMFYIMVFGLICDTILTLATKTSYFSSWLFLIIASILFIFAIMRPFRPMLLVAFLAGVMIADFRVDFELTGQRYFEQLTGKTVTLVGTLTESPDIESGSAKIRLTHIKMQQNSVVDSTGHNPPDNNGPPTTSQPEFNNQEIPGTIYVQLARAPDLERSDVVTLQGKLGTGFGVFVASMFRPELLKIERADPGDIFARLKNWFANLIKEHVSSPAAELGLGYLMGMNGGLSDQFSEALRAVGMTHVIVASGTHLGILASITKKIFGKISRFAAVFFSLLMVMSFVLVVGFTPSMTRAALVAILTLLMSYIGRRFTPWRLLSLVAAITLLISPMYFFNLGWQLSFSSFLGIMIVAPRMTKMFYGGKSPPWLASMILASLATCLTCAPLLIFNFGSISLLSFVANLIILPTLPYAMLLVFLTGVTSFWPALANLVGYFATGMLNFHIAVVEFLSEKTMLIIELESGDARIFLLYIMVILLLLIPNLAGFIRESIHRTHKPRAENRL